MRVWSIVCLFGLVGCSSGDQDAVLARLNALESRLDRMEGLGGVAAAGGLAGGGLAAFVPVAGEALTEGGAELPEGEEGAKLLFREARKHSRKLETAAALQRLATLQAHFPDSESAKRANRLKRDLGTIGTVVSELDVKVWFQGGADQVDLVQGMTLLLFADVTQTDAGEDLAAVKHLAGQYVGQLSLVSLVRGEEVMTEAQGKAFAGSLGLAIPVGQLTKGIKDTFQVKGTPSLALVKGGQVVWKGMVSELDQSLLERVL